jgi:hypothetical protein
MVRGWRQTTNKKKTKKKRAWMMIKVELTSLDEDLTTDPPTYSDQALFTPPPPNNSYSEFLSGFNSFLFLKLTPHSFLT